MTVAMTSRNAGSVRTRTVGTALYNMCVQTSNIISSNVRLLFPYLIPKQLYGNGADNIPENRYTEITTSPSIAPATKSS